MLENNSADLTIGFDVGGTNVRGGVITRDGEILASRTMPTSGDPRQLNDDLVAIVEELRVDYPVGAVGLAVAGFLDPECETVRFAPHLPWRNAPVRRNLAERLGLHVRLEHDANSAAWGEWRFGAGRGAKDWVFFAVGTGIGATLMTHDTIYRGAFGTAPEFGHIVVVPNGRQCSCGKRGCLERYASGTALPDTARELGVTDAYAHEQSIRAGARHLGADCGADASHTLRRSARVRTVYRHGGRERQNPRKVPGVSFCSRSGA